METDRDKCSSIRRMSGEEVDKGIHIAAKSSLSGARKKRKKSERNRRNLPHNRIND